MNETTPSSTYVEGRKRRGNVESIIGFLSTDETTLVPFCTKLTLSFYTHILHIPVFPSVRMYTKTGLVTGPYLGGGARGA